VAQTVLQRRQGMGGAGLNDSVLTIATHQIKTGYARFYITGINAGDPEIKITPWDSRIQLKTLEQNNSDESCHTTRCDSKPFN
jgi:hypothetical protein